MMKYEKPEVQVITFLETNIVTESNLYTNGTSVGGNEGGYNWDDL